MPKASEIKKGDVVDIDEIPHVVKTLESKSPSSRGAATIYKIRFTNLLSGQKKDVSCRSDESFSWVDCERITVQFSYVDGDQFIFMDTGDFSQHGLDRADIEAQLPFLSEGLADISALLIDGLMVAIDLPQAIVMSIADTAPAIKGASASARTKPATLTTGLVIQVPEYIETGEPVKVNSGTSKYMSRA
jgi:elongation factor P